MLPRTLPWIWSCPRARNSHSVLFVGGRIVSSADVGPERELKAKYPDAEYVDVRGSLITPGLINCNTHRMYVRSR